MKNKNNKVYLCPKCYSKLDFDKVSEGYFGACLSCDEDFYKIEVVEERDYPCKLCSDKADYNLQGDGWVLWEIKRTENGIGFDKRKEWGLGEGDNNEFFCTKCAEDEGII